MLGIRSELISIRRSVFLAGLFFCFCMVALVFILNKQFVYDLIFGVGKIVFSRECNYNMPFVC